MGGFKFDRLGLAAILAVTALPAAPAHVRRVAELTVPEIARLDRARTAVILPGGILEEHGPYLPAYADGYLNERLADSLAAAIASRPGWTALVFPPIPLGNSGANDIGGRFSFPGTYTVRFETLRAVFLDLADELGEQGFRWVFLVHLHGGPNHSRALDQAGDYFRHAFGGRMVHLAGLLSVIGAMEGPKSAEARAADGLVIHSGMDETSLLLHLRPDLVSREHLAATDEADSSMAGLIRLARAPGWPGYFGAPRLATAAHGQAIWRAIADSAVGAALRILDGADPSRLARYATAMAASPPDVRLDAASRRAEAARARRQQAWLASTGRR